MSWMGQIGNILQQYTGGSGQTPGSVHQDFDTVAQHAPPESLANGIVAMFRSDQTPPFAQMVGQLFGNSDGQQRAGLLNRLLSSMGPAALGSLAGSGALAGLPGMVANGEQVTPEQASSMSPDAVQELAAHAEQQNPSIVDRVGSFYAQHPGVVKTVGAAALSVAMAKILQR